MIEISDKALNHILELRRNLSQDSKNFHLRVGVKGGGCSGFSYVLDFDNEIKSDDEIINISEELTVLVQKKCLLYLIGTKLDFSDGLNGKGFHWINPQATRVCGCGESFSV